VTATLTRSPGAGSDRWSTEVVELYETQWSSLVRLARFLTGCDEAAEDLVQDVFVRSRDRLRHIDNKVAYLRVAVSNAARDFHRGQRRRADPSVVVLAPEAVDSESSHEVVDLLRTLSRRKRTALVLRYYEDLPDEEIAAILGCQPVTVRSIVHRAIVDLRRTAIST
jgi:RNA polymerase sigma factor (sigma-70 family)